MHRAPRHRQAASARTATKVGGRRWRSTLFCVGALAVGLLGASEGARGADPGIAVPVFEYDRRFDPNPFPIADRVVVEKRDRRMLLYVGDEILAEYEVSLGSVPIGPKRELGDGRTPEGRYRIDYRKSDSDYYRALHVSYPNPQDRARAEARGVQPGGAIMIHGLPNGLGVIGSAHLLVDWTDGCIAVTNEEMDELWELVPDGVPIELRP